MFTGPLYFVSISFIPKLSELFRILQHFLFKVIRSSHVSILFMDGLSTLKFKHKQVPSIRFKIIIIMVDWYVYNRLCLESRSEIFRPLHTHSFMKWKALNVHYNSLFSNMYTQNLYLNFVANLRLQGIMRFEYFGVTTTVPQLF